MTKTQILDLSGIVIRTLGTVAVTIGVILAAPARAEEDTAFVLTSAANDVGSALILDMPGMLHLEQAPEFANAEDWGTPDGKVTFSSVDTFFVSLTDQTAQYNLDLVRQINRDALSQNHGAPGLANMNLLNSNFSKSVVRTLTGAK